MGILSRFVDIMKANINDLLDKCEDPAKMVDQMLRDLQEQLADVKKETAGVMAEEKRCKGILDNAQAEVNKWSDLAKKALTAGNEGDAKAFIAKKQKAETDLAQATELHAIAKANADKMVQMHNKLANDINELNSRREMIKAKASMAKAQEKVNEATAGANINGSMAAFDSLEARVDKRLNAAASMAELNAEPTDATEELADKYATGGSDASVDAELARMKAEMGIQ